MTKPANNQTLGRRLQARLREAFATAHWKVTDTTVPEVDFLVESGRHRYVVEVKASREPRRAELVAFMAEAILRARAGAARFDARPLAVVGAPTMSRELVDDVRRFAKAYGHDVAWGVITDAGLVELHGPGLDAFTTAPDEVLKKSSHRVDLFSDLGQWCLKLLLSHRLPAEHQLLSMGMTESGRARQHTPVPNASALHEIAGVSMPTAARIAAALREEGFVAEGRRLEIVRPEALLTRWRAVNRARSPQDLHARFLFPERSSASDRLAALLKGVAVARRLEEGSRRRASFGLFAAAEHRGLGFVFGVTPHVYIEDTSPGALEELGLMIAEKGEAPDVLVRKPRFPESVFRGARVLEGVPSTDPIQTWLDVIDSPARGAEAAEFIRKQALHELLPRGEELGA